MLLNRAMNLERRFRIRWLCFLLPLVFLWSNGCSTNQADATVNQDLEKYRKVYLVRPEGDDRDLTAGILSRLKFAGFDAAETDEQGAKKMVAAKEVKEPTLICAFDAISTWNYERTFYCFDSVQIHFFDVATGERVFRADYFHPGSYLPENTELNHLFVKIRDGFFPNQPNPFRMNKKGPYGPSYRKFQTEAY